MLVEIIGMTTKALKKNESNRNIIGYSITEEKKHFN
jgi:hypothetical protein